MAIFRTADPIQDFNDWDNYQNNADDCPVCTICEEPIFDLDYIEYDQKRCHCDDECAHQFFDEYMKRDFTYMK